jgi:aspartyl protease family protein
MTLDDAARVSKSSRMWSDKLSDGGTVAEIVISLSFVILLISGLVARRRGAGGVMFKYATAWIVIAAILLIGYGMKDEAMRFGRKLLSELVPSMGLQSESAMSFRASSNGHFMVDALVDGRPIQFMIDSGASDVTLSLRDAERLGLDRAALKFDRTYQTANGVVRGAAVRLKRVEIGSIALDDVRASVNEAPMGVSLLGMSFLSRLSSWRVDGDRLTLVR